MSETPCIEIIMGTGFTALWKMIMFSIAGSDIFQPGDRCTAHLFNSNVIATPACYRIREVPLPRNGIISATIPDYKPLITNMGIPHLTRHLMPFSESIALGRNSGYQHDGLAYVDSIVIDGPSLVHHVFSRLLCFSNPNLEYADCQPTCNDVSSGVAIYLLQLMLLGVKMYGYVVECPKSQLYNICS